MPLASPLPVGSLQGSQSRGSPPHTHAVPRRPPCLAFLPFWTSLSRARCSEGAGMTAAGMSRAPALGVYNPGGPRLTNQTRQDHPRFMPKCPELGRRLRGGASEGMGLRVGSHGGGRTSAEVAWSWGERGREREDGRPQAGTGRLCWRNWGKAGRVRGRGPAKKQPGDKLGCRASPCLAIRAPEQCVGCGGCLAKVGSASGQDAGGLG